MACNQCEKKTNSKKPERKQTTKAIQTGVADYVRARAAQCAVCEHNNNGICQEQKKITPDKDCVIQIGVDIRSVANVHVAKVTAS